MIIGGEQRGGSRSGIRTGSGTNILVSTMFDMLQLVVDTRYIQEIICW